MYSNLLSIEQRHYVNQIGVNCMIKVFSNQMRDLVDTEVQIQRVASGFEFTEGPIWHPRDHHLLFSDIPGNSRLQYSSSEAIRVIRKPSSKCNGMTYNSDLNLLVCRRDMPPYCIRGVLRFKSFSLPPGHAPILYTWCAQI